MKRPADLIYAVDEVPPPNKLALLGLQQALILSIYLILVVVVTQHTALTPAQRLSTVSLALVVLGVATALQSSRLGSGYLMPTGNTATYLPPSLQAAAQGGMPLVNGLTILAGLAEMALAPLLRSMRAVFPTVLCGVITMAVGLQVGLLGADHVLDVGDRIATHKWDSHVATGFFTLTAMVALTIWGRGLARLLSAMLGLAAGALLAWRMDLVPSEALGVIASAPWMGLPGVAQISYSFTPEAALPFLIGALAAALRTVGVVSTCQRLNDADWKRPEPHSVVRGVLTDGAGCALAGVLGVPGTAASPSAVAISESTGATSRAVGWSAAAWLGLFALLPKMAACFLALPPSVLGGALMFTGSALLIGGLKIVVSQPLDMRHTLVVGLSLVLGLTREMYPDYYSTLSGPLALATNSMLSITTLTAVLLNLLFRLGIRRTARAHLDTDDTGLDRLVEETRRWASPAAARAEAEAAARSLVRWVQEQHLAQGPVSLRVSFDEVSYVVEVDYLGEPLRLPSYPPSQGMLADEHAVGHGLAGFLQEVHPDRLTSTSCGPRACVRAVFEV
ncbi:MAG TPA: solute carrier family 23 protein [Candidatus Nitrosotenuis sp.]|jgi:NCS2 family nucleobase:cation symporter-2|nr:solute carrier family 23 protein [Candidatus Nitrosotenuis sp.]